MLRPLITGWIIGTLIAGILLSKPARRIIAVGIAHLFSPVSAPSC